MRKSVLVALPTLLLALALAGPPPASAKRGLTTGIMDSHFRSSSDQDTWLDFTARTNAEVVRIGVSWWATAPTPPARPRDPSDPAYDFSETDAAVRAAARRGFRVLLTVRSTPPWAEGPDRPSTSSAPEGTWDPNPVAFGKFGQALAQRYSGEFRDPASAGGAALPRVRHFEAWNEPNLPMFFGPQWIRKKPRAPAIYRRLLKFFYKGVHSADRKNVVLGGGLAPYGDPRGGPRMRPLFFLRKLFCLKGRRKLKPKGRRCPPVKMDALSAHPISTGGPRRSAIHRDDAATADIGKVKRILRAAERHRNVKPRGRRPLWATEFWWLSDPPRPPGPPNTFGGVPLKKHARWIEEALYLFWKKGVKTAIYFKVRDPEDNAFPTGLFFADGTPKPAFQAFRFPFVTERRSKKRVRAWGKSPLKGKLSIERKRKGTWRKLWREKVRQGEVFATKLPLRGRARLRARVGDEQSLPWRQRR